MSSEKTAEFQYAAPLSRYIHLFSTGMAGGNEEPGNYPTDKRFDSLIETGWMFAHKPVVDAITLIEEVKSKKPNLRSIELFHAIVEALKLDTTYNGKTSQVLLGLFNPGWIEESIANELATLIYNDDTPLNPTFIENQPYNELPPNLQVRETIISTIISDMTYQSEIASGKMTGKSKYNNNDFRDLSRQRAEWYESLYRKMSDRVEIKPAEHTLT